LGYRGRGAGFTCTVATFMPGSKQFVDKAVNCAYIIGVVDQKVDPKNAPHDVLCLK